MFLLLVLGTLQTFPTSAKLTIDGVDGKLKDNIVLYLAQTTYPAAENLSELAVSKYKNEAEKEMRKALNAFGYFSPSFSYAKTKSKDTALLSGAVPIAAWAEKEVTLTIETGKVTTVSEFLLVFDLNDSAGAPAELNEALTSAKTALLNKPFISSEYDRHKSIIQSKATAFGYFNFKWVKSSVSVNSADAIAKINWQLAFSKRFQFGPILYLQDDRGSELVEAVKPFKQGDWFVQQQLGSFTQRIRQTGYFDSVIVRPNIEKVDSSQLQPLVPIELLLETKPKDSFQFGAGVSTDTGPRLTASWKRPWINLKGHSISSSAYISRPKQTLDLNYTVPMANPLNDFFKVQFGLENTQENQTDSTAYTLAVQRQFGAVDDDGWNKVGFVKYETETFTQGFQEQQTTQLLLPGLSLNRTRKDGEIFVDRGDRQFISIEGASKSVVSDIDLVRLQLSTKWIRTLDKHRIIARLDLGALVASDYDAVPSSLRFFTGGDQSIRGFGLNEVGQLSFSESKQALELVGGRYLNVASAEYAYAVADNWRAAVFVDAGGASKTFADEIAYGVGAGVHWLSPYGTVRLYLARGVSDTERNWRVHFNIGPGI